MKYTPSKKYIYQTKYNKQLQQTPTKQQNKTNKQQQQQIIIIETKS